MPTDSTPNVHQADRHDVAVAAIKEAYEQIGRSTDEYLARVDEKLSKTKQESDFDRSVQQTRPAGRDVLSRGRLGRRGIIGLFLAACVCVAAVNWQWTAHSTGVIVRWVSQRVSVPQLSLVKQEVPAQPTAILDVASPEAAQQDAPQTSAPMSSELAQQIRTLVRDLATAEQSMKQLNLSQEQLIRDNAELAERLKATQEQLGRDNAAVVEQLRAGQAQMARDLAAFAEQLKAVQTQIARDNTKAAEQLEAAQEQIARLIGNSAEQNLRFNPSAPPPRPTVAPRAKPGPTGPIQ